jgi:hypothetical protein
MRIEVTRHAAERFVQRHAPALSVDEATRFLAEATPGAGVLRERTFSGHEQRQLAEPRCILVVKRDPGGGLAVVTVLPRRDEIRLLRLEDLEFLEDEADRTPAVAEARAAVIAAGPPAGSKLGQRVNELRAQIATVARVARQAEARALARAETAERDRDVALAAYRELLRAVLIGEARRGAVTVQGARPDGST